MGVVEIPSRLRKWRASFSEEELEFWDNFMEEHGDSFNGKTVHTNYQREQRDLDGNLIGIHWGYGESFTDTKAMGRVFKSSNSDGIHIMLLPWEIQECVAKAFPEHGETLEEIFEF